MLSWDDILVKAIGIFLAGVVVGALMVGLVTRDTSDCTHVTQSSSKQVVEGVDRQTFESQTVKC